MGMGSSENCITGYMYYIYYVSIFAFRGAQLRLGVLSTCKANGAKAPAQRCWFRLWGVVDTQSHVETLLLFLWCAVSISIRISMVQVCWVLSIVALVSKLLSFSFAGMTCVPWTTPCSTRQQSCVLGDLAKQSMMRCVCVLARMCACNEMRLLHTANLAILFNENLGMGDGGKLTQSYITAHHQKQSTYKNEWPCGMCWVF